MRLFGASGLPRLSARPSGPTSAASANRENPRGLCEASGRAGGPHERPGANAWCCPFSPSSET